MTLQETLREIGSDFGTIAPNCYHYWRPNMQPPYLVWAETGEGNDFAADNRKAERVIAGNVHCFSREEYDPLFDAVEQMLNVKSASWNLENVQYEEETNLIHYSWVWTAKIRGWG